MEEGYTTLDEVMKQADDINFREKHVRKILYQLLCALKILHEAGIVHRDIKPCNVLLDQQYNVLLADFGLARTVPDSKLI
mmetsp:Transcript_18189/g.27986  ORF Transcript_18189/g.27986 Transcript_18189/m.27986 type:complete len:80 (-) Transcript_18189:813-1052(-)